MAQTDTGLGWSALSDWLINTPLLMGSIADFVEPYPFPHIAAGSAPSAATVVSAGASIVIGGHTYYILIQTNSVNGNVGIGIRNTNPGGSDNRAYIAAVSWDEGCSVGQYWVNICDGTVNRRYGSFAGRSLTEQASGGMYFAELTSLDNYSTLANQTAYDGTILAGGPSYDDLEQRYYSGSNDFYKVNPGYAVACFAKWKTPNGTILESPILISTESDNVEMSTTATGIYLAKLNALYDGRKFYMGFYDMPDTGTITTTLPVIDRSYSDAPTFTLEELFKYIAKDVYANIIVTNSPDPYQEGDGSGEAGGDGEEDESDEIPFTDAPVSGIAYSGFLTIFTPNLSQLQSLANYMWSDFFDVDTWKKLFANPMDAILGLHIIPCSPGYSGNKEVKVGGKRTGVSMDYTTIRYHEVSMGTCPVPKKWGSYLDYNPYTKVSIFLPYIGFRDLDTDDVMDRTLALQYIVDILTGACVAELRCGTDVLYSWEGNCANPVPITSNSWSSAIGSAVSIAAAIATTALTHGASAPMIAGTVASVGANSMNLKPSVSRSGSLGGSGGFIAKQTPYIIRTVPNLVIPADQNKFIGYPSFVTTSLGSLTGYNEISSIHLEGIPATGNELSEIETLLKGGVIF